MFAFFNQLFLNCRGSVEDVHQEIENFVVVQKPIFSDFEQTFCILVKGKDGKSYLEPKKILFESQTELPSIENWPAAAENIDQYWQRICKYPGGVVRQEHAISDLLNDIKINVPNKYFCYSTEAKDLSICDQVVVDLARTSQIIINKKKVFDNKQTHFETNETDQEKFIKVFKACEKELDSNVDLTHQVLKLSTQATLSRLAVLIIRRFSHEELMFGITCIKHAFIVKREPHQLMKIFYDTIWGIRELGTKKEDSKMFLKASIEMHVLEENIEKGKAGKDALFLERCSRFYESQKQAENCKLTFFGYPSFAETKDDYECLLNQMHEKEVYAHPYEIRHLLLESKKHRSEKKEAFLLSLFNKNYFETTLSINGFVVFDLNEINKPKDNSLCYETFLFEFDDNLLSHQILLISLQLIESSKKKFFQLFENKGLNNNLSFFDSTLDIKRQHDSLEITCLSRVNIDQEEMHMHMIFTGLVSNIIEDKMETFSLKHFITFQGV